MAPSRLRPPGFGEARRSFSEGGRAPIECPLRCASFPPCATLNALSETEWRHFEYRRTQGALGIRFRAEYRGARVGGGGDEAQDSKEPRRPAPGNPDGCSPPPQNTSKPR